MLANDFGKTSYRYTHTKARYSYSYIRIAESPVPTFIILSFPLIRLFRGVQNSLLPLPTPSPQPNPVPPGPYKRRFHILILGHRVEIRGLEIFAVAERGDAAWDGG